MKHNSLKGFISFSFFESIQPVLVISSLFFLGIGFPTSDIFLLKSIFLFSVFLFDIPGGIALDYFGSKFTLTYAKTFEICGLLVLLFSKNWWLISLAMILMGVSLALVSGARASISKLLEQDTGVDHKKTLAYVNFSMLAAYSITLFIAGFGKYPYGEKLLIGLQIISSLLTIYFIRNISSKSNQETSNVVSKKTINKIFIKENFHFSILSFAVYVAIIRILVELLPFSLKLFTGDTVEIGFLLGLLALAMAFSSWIIASSKNNFMKNLKMTNLFALLLISTGLLAPVFNFGIFFGLLLFIIIRTIGDIYFPSLVLTTSSNINSNATRLSIGNSIGTGLAAVISYSLSLFSEPSHMFYGLATMIGIMLFLMLLRKGFTNDKY